LLGNSSTGSYLDAPQKGTIFPYVARKMDLYRCPSLLQGQPGTAFNSNGRFDYAAYLIFSGAKVTRIRSTSRFTYPNGKQENVVTPLLCDEDPFYGINTANMEGGHSNGDRMAHRHHGGSFYASIDASVQWFNEPMPATSSWQWESQTREGKWVSLGNWQDPTSGNVVTWGWWNVQ